MSKGWLSALIGGKDAEATSSTPASTTQSAQDLQGNAAVQESLGLGSQGQASQDPAWWRDDPDGDRTEEGFFDHVKGVGIGVGEGVAGLVTGVKDLAVGLWNVTGGWLTDPDQARQSTDNLVSTVKAIAENPMVVVEAVLEPIKEDWEAGRPGEAIGRALFEIAGVVVGTKGVDKAAKASKLQKLTRLGKVDDVAGVTKLDDVGAISKLDDASGVGKLDDFAEVKLHDGKQGKHLEGHNNYIEGRSKLTADPEELLQKKGTGEQVGGLKPPAPGSKERVDFGEIIGEYVDPKTGVAAPTTKGIIHYSKDGAHIVPSRP